MISAVKPHHVDHDVRVLPEYVAHHFESEEQQFDAIKLGMWLFLVTEILFFGGLFVAYAVFRQLFPDVFVDASSLLDKNLGTANTVILLFSSLTMALSVRAAQLKKSRAVTSWLSITVACAIAFLGIKGVEYTHKWEEGLLWASRFDAHTHDTAGEHIESRSTAGVDEKSGRDNRSIFFSIYYCMTGLHAIHILGGIGAIVWLIARSVKGDFATGNFAPVDAVGLYWHLVDLVWIFLFPLLYLVN